MSSLSWRFFHPWWTYSSTGETAIRRSKEQIIRFNDNPEDLLPDDAATLWQLGNRAFKALDCKSLEAFSKAHSTYENWIAAFRAILRESETGVTFTTNSGEALAIDWLVEAPPHVILLAIATTSSPKEANITGALIQQLFLLCCLEEVNEAAELLVFHEQGAVTVAVNAMESLMIGLGVPHHGDVEQAARSRINSAAAAARHAKDPKREEKQFVHACYLEWQADPSRYSSVARFARDMLDKLTHLESQRVIEGWVRAWRRNASIDEIDILPARC